jgi:hypothetical protein
MSLYEAELLAYLAGCLDSDGFFTIRRDTRSMKAKSRTPTHVAMVGLRQVTPQVPRLLHATFGGHLGVTKSTATNGRDLIGWTVTAKKAMAVCEAVGPHLRIKATQARVLIELQERKTFGGRARIQESELTERDRLALLVQSLNKVGI